MIRVFLAFDDASFGQQLYEYPSEQPDFQVCGRVEIGDDPVREAIELRPDIATLEMSAAHDLQVANALKQHIPNLRLLLVAEEVSPEIEKEALAHGVDAVFPKQDDPTALALNVRVLYMPMGNQGEGGS